MMCIQFNIQYLMSSFILAGIISVLYALFRFLEMRFILKETKPLKFILRDAIIVYLSVIAGIFIMEQVENNIPQAGGSKPEVHLGEANF